MRWISDYVEWMRSQSSSAGKLFAYGLPLAAVISLGAGVALNLVKSSSSSQAQAQTQTQPTATAVATLRPTPAPSPTPQPLATATAAAPATYTVVSGDNPTVIARKLGVPQDQQAAWLQQMLTLNDTTDRAIQVGQVLKLPPTTPVGPTPTPAR